MSQFDEQKDQLEADLKEEIRARVALTMNELVEESKKAKGYTEEEVTEEEESEDDESEEEEDGEESEKDDDDESDEEDDDE